MRNILDQLTKAWAQHQSAIVLGAAAVAVVLLAIAGWRFARTRERSKVVSTLAAVIVMAWTSEGLLAVALRTIHLPLAFALLTFTVFEMMMLAAGLRAEEHRATKGTPGPAGAYVFVVAGTSGLISSLGAHSVAEVVLRIVLPPLAVGLWWIALVGERPGDDPEWKAERARRAAEREATWAITPRTILVKVGLMKPGRTTTTEAQREHQIARMVVAADTIAANGRGVARARTRLRRLARTADAEMIATVAERVRQAVEAERLMVPDVDGRRDGGRAREAAVTAPASRTSVPVQPERDTQDGGQDVPERAAGTVEQSAPVRVPDGVSTVTVPAVPVSPVPSPRGRGAVRTDDELRAALATVTRDEDGTIPPRRAATALGCGYERAKRLIEEAGLLPGGHGVNGHGLVRVGSTQE